MTFDEHVHQHCTSPGEYDIAAAEEARAAEIMAAPGALEELAHKVAADERRKWETRESEHLRSQFKIGFAQGVLDLDLEVLVPLGESVHVALGDMNHERMRTRLDIRTRVHLRENDAYGREAEFWFNAMAITPATGTIRDIV